VSSGDGVFEGIVDVLASILTIAAISITEGAAVPFIESLAAGVDYVSVQLEIGKARRLAQSEVLVGKVRTEGLTVQTSTFSVSASKLIRVGDSSGIFPDDSLGNNVERGRDLGIAGAPIDGVNFFTQKRNFSYVDTSRDGDAKWRSSWRPRITAWLSPRGIESGEPTLSDLNTGKVRGILQTGDSTPSYAQAEGLDVMTQKLTLFQQWYQTVENTFGRYCNGVTDNIPYSLNFALPHPEILDFNNNLVNNYNMLLVGSGTDPNEYYWYGWFDGSAWQFDPTVFDNFQ
jgi:hypothetical protein